MPAKTKSGFSLIEVIVAAFMVGIAVASLMGALATFSRSQRLMLERETLERLADSMLQEQAATRLYREEPEGTFADQGQPDYTWSAEEEVTGVENLYELRLTVEKTGTQLSTTVRTLVFSPPLPVEEGA